MPISRYPTGKRAPALETKRLKLRSHTVEDFAACSAMWADPAVVRYIGGKPSSQQQTWGRILNYVGHWSLMGFGYWAIEEKSSGQYIGETGFADFQRDIEPSIKGIPEIGWALIPKAHGKGYATEALEAVIAWGDSHFGPKRTVCLISPGNEVSIHVAKKFGYAEFQRTIYQKERTILFYREADSRAS